MLDIRIKDAIDKKSGNLLIIGPPGTGKTKTLINIIGYLIQDKKIDPRRVLVFCFNRRWTKFIRERSANFIGKTIFEIPVETFYSFCIDFLEKVNAIFRKNYLPVKVLNSVQQWKLLREIVEGVDRKNYPYTHKLVYQNPFTAQSYIQEVFDFILRAQENLLTPRHLSDRFTPFINPILSEIVGIYAKYRERLHTENSYNYGRLLEEVAEILRNDNEVETFFKRQYEWILVDEAQEINKAQFEIVNFLTHGNCIYFGNDDEAIYAFRGSMVNNFKYIYESLSPENIFFLKKDYRSSPVLNKISQSFILQNRNRIAKESYVLDESLICNGSSSGESSKESKDGEFIIKRFSSLLEEVSFVCYKIKELCLTRELDLGDIAIIVKGFGYETHIIENSLKQNNIPFSRRGTRGLLDDAFVRFIMNFMELVLLVRDYDRYKCNNKNKEHKNNNKEHKDNNKEYIDNKYEGIGHKGNECKSSTNNKYNKYENKNISGNIGEVVLRLNNIIEEVLLSDFIGFNPLYFEKLKSVYEKHKFGYKDTFSTVNKNKITSSSSALDLWQTLTNLTDMGIERIGEAWDEIVSDENDKKSNFESGGKTNSDIRSITSDSFDRKSSPRKDSEDELKVELIKLVNFIDLVKELISYLEKPVYYFILKLLSDRRFGFLKRLGSRKSKGKEFLLLSPTHNLRDFLESVKDFCKTNQDGSDVASYIDFINNILENRFLEEVEESTRDFYIRGRVNILSFHQCKGLEFKAVFLPFVNRHYLPSKLDFPQSYDKQIFNYFSDRSTLDFSKLREIHIEEERKLFYVGMTRASNYLYITCNQHQEKSIFFEELEEIYKDLLRGEKKKREEKGKEEENEKVKEENKRKENEYEFIYGPKRTEMEQTKAKQDLTHIKEIAPTKSRTKIEEATKNFILDLDFVLPDRWKIRKKAIVLTYRLINGLSIDFESYFTKLFSLNLFYPPSEWWTFTKSTINNYDPFLVYPPVFSYSSLNTFKECPLKYSIRYFLGLEDEEDLSLKVGKIYHQILSSFFRSYDKNKKQKWEDLEKILVETFSSEYFDFPFLKKELMEKAYKEFRNFFLNYLPEMSDTSIVEKDFSFYLGEDCITGRIDQINFYDNDVIDLIDYKSSSSRPSQSQLKEEIQLKIYMLAINLSKDLSFLKNKKLRLKYFLFGQLSNSSPNPVCEIPEEYYTLEDVSAFVEELILRLKKEEFKPLPENYMVCKTCNYRILCPRHCKVDF